MAAGGGSSSKDRDARAARERTRVYQARQELYRSQVRRRSRDNLIAGIVGGILILAVVGGQIAYYTAGPGMPSPSPSDSATPTPTVTDDLPFSNPSATP